MSGAVEKAYGKLLKCMYVAANPIKKAVVNTHCNIHKYINFLSLEILKNDNFQDAFEFFSDYLPELNEGTVWADQDFKSTGHFYCPLKGKGLYGNTNALSLAIEYYNKALCLWRENKVETSIFYLGAAVHLVQDMTIPQHANIRLLDNHRQFENFVKRTFMETPEFIALDRGYYMNTIEEFISFNARNAIKIHNRLRVIENEEKRYFTICRYILPLAQRTTAGSLILFYRDIQKVKK